MQDIYWERYVHVDTIEDETTSLIFHNGGIYTTCSFFSLARTKWVSGTVGEDIVLVGDSL